GETWRRISTDLAAPAGFTVPAAAAASGGAGAPAAGGAITALAPSPVAAGVIWVGTSTGLIHLTRDGGKTWSNVTPPNLPVWSKVTQIEASHFEPGTAWAAVDRHRREDYRPYVYRTHDFGKTWTLAAEGLSEPAYLNSIKED